VKRISFWFLSTLSAVVLLFGFDASRHDSSLSATAPITSGSTGGTGSSDQTSGQGSGNGSGNAGNGNAGSSTTVTGAVAQTEWGPVQVQLVVKGGTITAVNVVQYPSGNSRDTEINNFALPILIRETTEAQSAQIDMVSGATVTSNGYLQSLQSALDQANL
jgi:hypothetical protein